MGCWNGTCGLSGLPIIHGTEMYVFPIVESYRDSFCYSSALYRPSLIPFRAEYNDYGAGENCTGVGLDFLMDGVRAQLVEMEVGENQYHDIAVKRECFDVEVFFETCHKKRLRFQNPMRGYEGEQQTKDVFFTMIRKDVVDRLWNEWVFDMWKPSGMKQAPVGFETSQYYVKDVTYSKMSELIPEFMSQCFDRFTANLKDFAETDASDPETAKKLKAIKECQIYRELQQFFDQPYSERDHLLSDKFSNMFDSNYADGGFARFGDLKDTILVEYLQGDKEVAYAIVRECLVGYMVNSFMESTRKIWTPPMHQGSQSECLDQYRLMNVITNDIMAARDAEYGDDDADDDLFSEKGIYLLKDKVVTN